MSLRGVTYETTFSNATGCDASVIVMSNGKVYLLPGNNLRADKTVEIGADTEASTDVEVSIDWS
jgi:hypothetical protein